MLYIEIASWIALAVALASLHTFVPKERPASPWFLYLAMTLGSLVGGFAVGFMHLPPLRVHGYSLATLLGALVVAEMNSVFLQRPAPRRT